MSKNPIKQRLSEHGSTHLRTITVFAPVPEESVARLTEVMRSLQDEPSPFAIAPGTHFARLAVLGRDEFTPQERPQGMRRRARLLDLLMHGGRPQKPDQPSRSYLLFTANYDGAPGADDDTAYLDGLRLHLQERADRVFGLCSDYPGWADRAGFLTWFAERSLPARYLFSASDAEPSVERIRAALQLRQQVVELALRSEGSSDDELAEAFRKSFVTRDDQTSAPESTGSQIPTPTTAEPALLDPATGVELIAQADRSPETDPNLDDVQNLVASGYPRHQSARHLLLHVTDPVPARAWLARVAEAIPTAGWADGFVDRMDYETVERNAAPEGRAGSPAFAVHLALSFSGLSRLGLPENELRGFASEFQAGMASREAGLAPGRGTDPWQAPFTSSAVDVLLMFSATDPDALADELTDRPELVPTAADGLHLLQEIEAGRIREDRFGPDDGSKPGFLEHFGFVDGLSQPRIHGVTTGRRVAELPAGEALLGYADVDGDTAGAGLPAALARNGSYLVYRKLEQDVPGFRALSRKLGERLMDGPAADRPRVEGVRPGTDPEELGAAKLMGRWRNGTPLTLSPTSNEAPAYPETFGFQVDDATGHGCPVGSHIRRANPRDSRPVDPNSKAQTGGEAGLEATLALRHRMLRRGIPYGTPLSFSAADHGDTTGLDEERGLLFVALVGDLRRQFEFVQAHWMADGNAFRLGTDRDVLAGASEEGNKFVAQGNPPTFVQPTTPVVTCRGGEYFFLPGIAALKRIAATQPA